MKISGLAIAILFIFTAPLLLFADKPEDLGDKTLVTWVAPANLTQRGGSALTLEKEGGIFDGVVFGELSQAKWMAGSENFSRTQSRQNDYHSETAGVDEVVQLAVVYRGKQVTIYRNGTRYAQYDAKSQQQFGDGSFILMGLRHIERKEKLEGHYLHRENRRRASL